MSYRFVPQRKPSVEFKFCPKCGTRNEGYRHFCKVCMTKLDVAIE